MGDHKTSDNAEIAELVKEHINNLDDKGKLNLPDDMPSWQKHVIRSEKRQRDAQAELSKSQMAFRGAEAENSVLRDSALTMIPTEFQLSEADITALDKLKFKDPDAYRLKVNQLEKDALAAQAKNVDELTTKAREDASNKHVVKSRVEVLVDFKAANPDLVITDDVLAYDVPPRLLAGVESGKYTYAEYLEKVKVYVTTGKSAASKEDGDSHSMNNMPGSRTPGKSAAEKAGRNDFAKITF